MTRPTWEEYWVNMVKAISARGTCDRGQSGAIIVKDNTMISSGYVGSAAGDDHCDDVGHKFEHRIVNIETMTCIKEWDNTTRLYNKIPEVLKLYPEDYTIHCIRTIHAEQNAICQAAKHGHAVNEATIYCSMVPCRACAMMIINSGIKEVIALKEYQTSQHTKDLFDKCGIKLKVLDSTEESY